MLRIVFFSTLSMLMLLFMAVQYNDPDGLLWVIIYSVPAYWCTVGAARPGLLRRAPYYHGLLFSLSAALVGVLYFWPLTPNFWTKAVWYEVETAREGMGLMIAFLVLGFVYLLARQQRTGPSSASCGASESHSNQ